ncbi:hypothetical protein SAZ11_11085 [Streptomyces sp. FXJ1.4098]|nr:hypothetical protein [Streptomyces sp. FXJ1.4098]
MSSSDGPGDFLQDNNVWGRPDNERVFAGHGGIRAGDTSMVTVPEGTSVATYSKHGMDLPEEVARMVEEGNPTPTRVFQPGEQLPDYSLFPPGRWGANPTSTVVTEETRLSQLLEPNMGRVHWAACRSII